MGFFWAVLVLTGGLTSISAAAESAAKLDPTVYIYSTQAELDARCVVTFHVANTTTDWKRDYSLTPKQLDAVLTWAPKIGGIATKAVVAVDYSHSIRAGFHGGSQAWFYAWVLAHFAPEAASVAARKRFMWASVAIGAAYEIAKLQIVGDPETRAQAAIKKVLRSFSVLEEDIPQVFRAIRERVPQNIEDIRDGSCKPYQWPMRMADKNYVGMQNLAIGIGQERGGGEEE